jgi:hypothetical protein
MPFSKYYDCSAKFLGSLRFQKLSNLSFGYFVSEGLPIALNQNHRWTVVLAVEATILIGGAVAQLVRANDS